MRECTIANFGWGRAGKITSHDQRLVNIGAVAFAYIMTQIERALRARRRW